MTLLPSSTHLTVDQTASGVVVWAVQRGLNERGGPVVPLIEDSVYGDRTRATVVNFQNRQGLLMDGRFGPKTSERLGRILAVQTAAGLPQSLLASMVLNESGFYIAAVNFSVAGGVDCGYTQRRVYSADFEDLAVVRRAFDPLYQFNLLANALVSRYAAWFGDTGAATHERAWRLAALNHNYPYAASKIAAVGVGGLTSYWTTPQEWVRAIGTKFPSGRAVQTPLEWCQRYALGNDAEGEPGQAVRLVTNWTT